ncbi:MAG: DUF2804 domain-containing protein [Deltaproteobacteria bacterium]|nr:DUF2804 domain-containing protein [Deltaproteobacteria bacterium]
MNRLIDAAGKVRFGIFGNPIDEVNQRDFVLTDPFGRRVGRLRRHFAFNQFEFLGAVCEDLVFGCAIADVQYAGSVFVYAYEPSTKCMHERRFRRPLALGIRCDQRPESGSAVFRAGGAFVEMSAGGGPGQRRLRVELAPEFVIDAVFSEAGPAIQPMRICTPAGAAGWVYARKTAGHRVAGSLRVAGRTFDLAAIGARGHHDWSAGYMRRHTFWNWGCLAGSLADGRVVGLNVSCGVNETSFTENCFWLDGQLHKLDTVFFDYDRRDLLKPWRLTSYDGCLDLEFRPEARYAESINALVIASNFQQLIGRYSGRLEIANGERLALSDHLGYAEHHYAKW